MSNKTIIIQAKVTTQLRPYECQVVSIGNIRTFVLDNAKQDQTDNLSDLAPGCKVFDDGALYRIKDIWFSPDSKFAFLAVYPD